MTTALVSGLAEVFESGRIGASGPDGRSMRG